MSRSREELIRRLGSELGRVEPAAHPLAAGGLWLLVSWAFVIGLTLALGPMRPGFGAQLLASPQFLIESLLGLIASALTIWAAFELGVPQLGSLVRRVALPTAVLLAWVLAYVIGLFSPALDPSMLGKREGCTLQALMFSLPILGLGIWQLRRAMPLARGWTGALTGAAAGALPALTMQMACMYDPAHILEHHIAPILAAMVLGAAAGRLFLRRL